MTPQQRRLVKQAYDLVERLEAERRRLYALVDRALGRASFRPEIIFERTDRLLAIATRARARHQRRMSAARRASPG
jgi:hypothetical protein